MLHKIFKKEILYFYIPILQKYKSIFVLMSLSGIISGASSVLIPLLLKLETDQLVEQNTRIIFWSEIWAFQVFLIILWCIVLVNILETCLSSLSSIILNSKEDLLRNEVQFHLFKRMKNMEIGTAMSNRYKYLTEIVDQSIQNLTNTLTNIPKSTIQFVIEIVGITLIYLYFDIRLLFVVIFSALIAYILEKITRNISKKYEVHWKFSLWREVWRYARLFLQNFAPLSMSWGLLSTLSNYEKVLKEENKHTIKRDFSNFFWNLNTLINYNIRDVILKVIVGYGVFMWTNSVGMVVLVVTSMGTIWNLISSILSLHIHYKQILFDQESLILLFQIIASVWDKPWVWKIENIAFQKVSFTYPNLAYCEKEYIQIVKKYFSDKTRSQYSHLDTQMEYLIDTLEDDMKTEYPTTLTSISLSFNKGKVYGIVGKNGAWKTTLMYLLAWFYRGYKGEILMNWEKTRNISNDFFLTHISFLTQSPFMLDWWTSIRENIFLWVDTDNKEAQAWRYFEKFWLAKKIQKLKKWIDSEIWNDVDFSGGEIQLLTFIRLLLQDRDVIILDEGTNQLDAENEILVLNELLRYKQDKIIIFITHRMSTISKVDEIYCIENNSISHNGNHQSLLWDANNPYARFYKAQVLHQE